MSNALIDSVLSVVIPAAHAATETAAEHGAGGHGGHDASHGEGLLFSSPEFWVGLAFVVVVVAALKPAGRALTTALDMRAARIKARLDEAEQLAADAQAMLADYQRRQRDAMGQAEEIIAHARAEADRLAKESEQRLEESLQRREQAAMERIAQAEAQALADVRAAAVDLAIAAAGRVIGENMTDRQSGALVDRAIKDLPDRLH